MASFFDEIARNRLKSLLLMVLFSLLFFAIIYAVVWLFGGGLFGLMVGGAIVIGYAFFSYFYGSSMVLKMSRAKPASQNDYPVLYEVVGGLAAAGQIKMPKIYVIDTKDPNAFATGRNKNNASVAVTTGLLGMMNKDELEGVLAHEISHIYNNDIQFMMLTVVFGGVIGLIAAFFRYSFFFGGFGGNNRNGGLLILVELALAIIAPIIATLLRLAISRKREYMADANGARMTRDPGSLASALGKIRDFTQNPQKVAAAQQGSSYANPVTTYLYFSNPISMKSIGNLLSTHPPIEERIKRLQNMH